MEASTFSGYVALAEDQAGWDATLVPSGMNVIVRVTGAAGNNITWHVTTVVQYVGT
ncbi:MAG: hypothetical protein ABSA52_14460 [Candidatus Binatia bacterium]